MIIDLAEDEIKILLNGLSYLYRYVPVEEGKYDKLHRKLNDELREYLNLRIKKTLEAKTK